MDSVLFVVAHPDDVAVAMGGTALLLKEKYALHIICATKGERGIAGKSLAEAGEIREKEEMEECRMLSAELRFLGSIDRELFADRATSIKVADIVNELSPAAVFTLWPIDSHPDHSAVSELASKGIFLSGKSPEMVFSGEGTSQISYFHPDFHVSISRVIDRKLELIRCHSSQNQDDLLAKSMLEKSLLRGRECGYGHAEVFKSLRRPDTGSILDNIHIKGR